MPAVLDEYTVDLVPADQVRPARRRTAYQAVLTAWANENRLPVHRLIQDRDIVVDITYKRIFYTRSYIDADLRPKIYIKGSDGLPDRAQICDRMLTAPAGILIGADTCGYPTTLGRGETRSHLTCTVDVDPDGRHPGPHRDGSESWFNRLPGALAYTGGRPDITGLPPAQQHAQVLAALDARAERIRTTGGHHREDDLAGIEGRRRVLGRHAPVVETGMTVCPPCDEGAVRSIWPCDDYRDAAAGLITGLDGA